MYRLLSQRLRDAEGAPEVYKYGEFPETFRNQFYTIVSNSLEMASESSYGPSQATIVDWLCRAFSLVKGLKCICGGTYYEENSLTALEVYIDKCSNLDFLDLMDFVFGSFISNSSIQKHLGIHRDTFSRTAIAELNYRLKQNRLGYEFQHGEIIIKTNTITHEEIVKPALKLLTDEKFRGAEEEYLAAFEHFRNGQNKDAILNAEKAFESVMKIICQELGYAFNSKRDTAQKLIQILEDNRFYPSYMNDHMTAIRKTLESGAPVLRNKEAGHGQGPEVEIVGDEYVEYVLNLVATNMVFLYKLYQKKSSEGLSK